MRARHRLLAGLGAFGGAAVAAGLFVGQLTTSAIDPYYRQVAARTDARPVVSEYAPTQPAPVSYAAFAPAEWPDATPPPASEHAFDEPMPVPTYEMDTPPEPIAFDPEAVTAPVEMPPETLAPVAPPVPEPVDPAIF